MDITAYQGDSRTLRITVQDEDGNPLDLTGYVITWTLMKMPNGAPPVARTPYAVTDLAKGAVVALRKTSSGAGVTVTNALGGVFEVPLSPTDTATLVGPHYHEAVLVRGNARSTVVAGVLTFLRTAGV